MNKNVALGTGIVVVVAVLGWYAMTEHYSPAEISDTATTSQALSTNAAPAPKAAASKTSAATKQTAGVPNPNTFKSLLTQSGSYQCDYDQVQASGKSHNVIYMYGGKMRGEFRTDNNGITISNLFVYDGHYLYQWKEGTAAGTKTVLTSLSELPLAIPKDLTSGAIVGNSYESVGWLCHTWLTNKALLAPPSYVTFS